MASHERKESMRQPDYSEADYKREQASLEEHTRLREMEEQRYERSDNAEVQNPPNKEQ